MLTPAKFTYHLAFFPVSFVPLFLITLLIVTMAKVQIITFGISELTVNIPHTRRSRQMCPSKSEIDRNPLLIRVFRLDVFVFQSIGL